jgi:hypothetical protein
MTINLPQVLYPNDWLAVCGACVGDGAASVRGRTVATVAVPGSDVLTVESEMHDLWTRASQGGVRGVGREGDTVSASCEHEPALAYSRPMTARTKRGLYRN